MNSEDRGDQTPGEQPASIESLEQITAALLPMITAQLKMATAYLAQIRPDAQTATVLAAHNPTSDEWDVAPGTTLPYVHSAINFEVRTPITSIVGYSDLLLNDNAVAKEHWESFVRVINSNGRRVQEVIRDCTDWLRHTRQATQLLNRERSLRLGA